MAKDKTQQRAELQQRTKRFRSSWVELAEALSLVHQSKDHAAWGYPDFADYCRKELKLTPNTVNKLVASYRYLSTSNPQVLERDGIAQRIPTVEAVQLLRTTAERCGLGEFGTEVLESVQKSIIEDNLPLAQVIKKHKEVIATKPPVEDVHRKSREQVLKTLTQLWRDVAKTKDFLPPGVLAAFLPALQALIDAVRGTDLQPEPVSTESDGKPMSIFVKGKSLLDAASEAQVSS